MQRSFETDYFIGNIKYPKNVVYTDVSSSIIFRKIVKIIGIKQYINSIFILYSSGIYIKVLDGN